MKTTISVKKEDLLRLLNVALEKEQRRKILNEGCHFYLIIEPSVEEEDYIDEDHHFYYMYAEYFTSPLNSDRSKYTIETSKIGYLIPTAVSFSNPDDDDFLMPIFIGLGISIQEIIDAVNKINNDTITIEMEPIEVDGILSLSILSIEDLFSIVD